MLPISSHENPDARRNQYVYHLKKKFGVEKTLRISENHPSNRIIPYIIQPSIFYTSFNYVQTLPVRAPQAPSKEESFPNHPFLDAFAVSLKKDIRIKSDVNIPLQKIPQFWRNTAKIKTSSRTAGKKDLHPRSLT